MSGLAEEQGAGNGGVCPRLPKSQCPVAQKVVPRDRWQYCQLAGCLAAVCFGRDQPGLAP